MEKENRIISIKSQLERRNRFISTPERLPRYYEHGIRLAPPDPIRLFKPFKEKLFGGLYICECGLSGGAGGVLTDSLFQLKRLVFHPDSFSSKELLIGVGIGMLVGFGVGFLTVKENIDPSAVLEID